VADGLENASANCAQAPPLIVGSLLNVRSVVQHFRQNCWHIGCVLLFVLHRLRCDFVAVLLFCQCGSDRVDIKLWNVRRAQLHCLTCGHEAWLEGFTVSEFDPAKLLTAAVIDQARKHRRRPPDEVRRIEEHRKTRSR
jgi:hypothetical protein